MTSFLLESAALLCAGWASGCTRYMGNTTASTIADWVLIVVALLILLVQLYRGFFVDRSLRLARWLIVALVGTMMGLAASQLGGYGSSSTAVALLCITTFSFFVFFIVYLARDALFPAVGIAKAKGGSPSLDSKNEAPAVKPARSDKGDKGEKSERRSRRHRHH
jgi:hypothetical protein